jgi:hypothetical protein
VRGAEESQPSIVETAQATMISLPFSDTPVINRNKELRKKGGSQRRSSLGMRGRRASSLIDNGHSALPHREVETHDFYKHIEADGPSEPRRMKQLLTWVGERALGEKPSHGKDSAAELAGKFLKGLCLELLMADSACYHRAIAQGFWKQVRVLRLVRSRRDCATSQDYQKAQSSKR